jgi:hypothetical protein
LEIAEEHSFMAAVNGILQSRGALV